MLAQNFKTAEDLKLTEEEKTTLVSVLHMLQRDELVHGDHNKPSGLHGFNMDQMFTKTKCGTVGCLLGWARYISGDKDERLFPAVKIWGRNGEPLLDLFMFERTRHSAPWYDKRRSVTPAQASYALRSFLTTGDSRWEEALNIKD